MQRTPTLTLAVMGSVALAAPAWADCAFGPSPIVLCDGLDSDGFDDPTDGLDLTVAPSGSVSTDDTAIRLRGDDGRVTVFGSVTSRDDIGVRVADDGTVTNRNTIFAGGDGVRVGDDATVVNDAQSTFDALIQAGDDGVQSGDGLNLTNNGLIEAEDEGVNADDDVTVVNMSGAVIRGRDDGVKVGLSASITNSGTIESRGAAPSDPQDAIDIDTGSITNLAGGIIRSDSDAAIDFDEVDPSDATVSEVRNDGLIEGSMSGGVAITVDQLNVSRQAVTNRANGRIVGDVALGGGNDLFSAEGTSDVEGTVFLGVGEDLLNFGAGFTSTETTSYEGGAGSDAVIFDGVRIDQIMTVQFAGGVDLSVTRDDSSRYQATLIGFESFALGIGSAPPLDLDGFIAATTMAPIPLPAAGWLMMAALGGLALRRRTA